MATATTTTQTITPHVGRDAPSTATFRNDHTPGKTSAHTVRLACRSNGHTSPTAGLAHGHIQANLLILPSKHADDFRHLCARNPVPCPLLAESIEPGNFSQLRSCVPGVEGERFVNVDFDIRSDLPGYNVYRRGQLVEQNVKDVKQHWTDDHVAFLIGCSFSFETALAQAGLPARHTLQPGKNCPMWRTNIPLCPAGVFRNGTYVVSMRPYPVSQVEKVRDITRAYGMTHGEPIDWGWDAVERLGIEDIDTPDWGDAAVSLNGGSLGEESWGKDEEVPVFWGCGVTPQEAVMRAGERLEGTVMAHAPGHMLVLDLRDEDVKSS